jgi:hypothetical protein
VTRVRAAPSDSIRAILCFKFDRHAEPGEVAQFRNEILGCDEVVHAIDLEGGFDFILEAEVRGFTAYRSLVDRLTGRFASLVADLRACFVCRRYLRDDQRRDENFWVPVPDGFRRLPCSRIDRVTAEGDYVRLHLADSSYLYHATMAAMEERLDPARFVRLHRSTIVRIAHIERLSHRNHAWLAVLEDGSAQRVAKSHIVEVRARIFAASSIDNGHSPIKSSSGDSTRTVVEQAMTVSS